MILLFVDESKEVDAILSELSAVIWNIANPTAPIMQIIIKISIIVNLFKKFGFFILTISFPIIFQSFRLLWFYLVLQIFIFFINYY